MSWPLKGSGSPIAVTGGDTLGSVKTATLTGGTGNIQWAHFDPTTGAYVADIAGATGSTYTIAVADAGYIVGAYVTSYAPSAHGSTPVPPTQMYSADYNVFNGTSAEKVAAYEPNRTTLVVKNLSLGNIFIAENADLNYQKNRPSSGFVTVGPGQEYFSDTGKTTYCKSYGAVSTAATYTAGTATVTMAAHGFVVGQAIVVSGAVPTGYNTNATAQYPNTVNVASVIDANNFTYAPILVPTGTATTQLTVTSCATVQVEKVVTV